MTSKNTIEVNETGIKISKNSQKNTCARVSFLVKSQASACNFIKKEILAQVFICEFCEIFKNTFFTEQLWVTASVNGFLTRKFRKIHRSFFIDKVAGLSMTY